MPLRHGTSRKVVSSNIRELRKGGTFRRTRRKFGVRKAHKQSIAIALNEARKSSHMARKRT